MGRPRQPLIRGDRERGRQFLFLLLVQRHLAIVPSKGMHVRNQRFDLVIGTRLDVPLEGLVHSSDLGYLARLDRQVVPNESVKVGTVGFLAKGTEDMTPVGGRCGGLVTNPCKARLSRTTRAAEVGTYWQLTMLRPPPVADVECVQSVTGGRL